MSERTFRVYPSERRRGLHVTVKVFETVTAMRKHVGDGRRKALGCCRQWEGRVGKRRDPMIAEVAFAKPYLTPYVVSHELLHATFAWSRRTKCTDEERMCETLGNFLSQAIERLAASQQGDEE